MTQAQVWRMAMAGAPEVLEATTIELPQPQAGQMLIKVAGSGFNPIDTKIRAGIAPITPIEGVLGCDVSGEIVALSEDISDFAVGDAVYGCAGGVAGSWGSLADYMLVDAQLMAKAPLQIPLIESATIPLVAITAWECLQRLALKAGDELLVLGGSGGVGQWLVQLALQKGAKVSATAGTENRCAQLKSYGAEALLHHQLDEQKTFDAVVDTVGGDVFQQALLKAKAYGQVATINGRNQYDLSQAHAKALTIHAVFMLLPLLRNEGRARHGQFLQKLAQQIDVGIFTAPTPEILPMDQVVAIHQQYEESGLNNKVVFSPKG